MSTTSQLRVIIAGGSVAGLTLANCFEKAGIDYVLLERGAEIVYDVGASIGLMANGLRIMDQLDVFEAIRKTTEPLAATYHRTPDGIPYSSSNYMHALEERLGNDPI
jgi:FAD dependent monooxygenase